MTHTTATLTIALATPEQYEAIDQLIVEAYAHDYGPNEHRDAMNFAKNRAEEFDVWAARDEQGELVASITTRRADGPSLHEDVRDNELDLRLLGVSPSARRRGIGAALMQFVRDHAAEAGYDAVFLKTAPNMTGAHQLYEALGYERDTARDGLWIRGEKLFELYTYVLPVR